jgi:hypothetical protein
MRISGSQKRRDQYVSRDQMDAVISRNFKGRTGCFGGYEKIRRRRRLATNMRVKKGQKISVTATGSIRVGLFAGVSTPNGIGGLEQYSYERYINHGALMVRVKESDGSGTWKACGSSCSFNANVAGEIVFLVNDLDASNNSGNYSISVLIED